MATNRGVVYIGPGKVEVQGIDYYPKFVAPNGKEIDHGAVLRIVSTNICGSDQHMVRGRTTAPAGLVLGHEITGEIIEKGSGVEFFEIGDLVSVPFNVACGRCRNCREQKTGICLNVNPARAGGAYGYVDMGGWVGGQAEWVMVPYADFNLLKFPDKAQAMEKIRDLTCLSDYLTHRLSRCGYSRRRSRNDCLYRGCWACWPGMCRGMSTPWCCRCYCRRFEQGTSTASSLVRLRNC